MVPIIEIRKVTKKFGKIVVLKEVNLSVSKASCIGIAGANGSGKSVLFKLIAGLERATIGEVKVEGSIIGKDLDFPQNIGILIDEPGFIELYTGFENLKFLATIKNSIDDKRIASVMADVGLLSDSQIKVKNYSMGMKKKLGIAQAIMEDQDIILLDEPFNALDFKTVTELKNIIEKLKAKKKTVILTGHNHSDLEELCDEIYYLDNGLLVLFDEELKQKYFNK